MKKSLAFFDFDGTITKADTLFAFCRYVKGYRRFATGLLFTAPYMILYKLKLMSNQRAKEKVLAHFFNGMPLDVFNEYCRKFAHDILPRLLRPKAIAEMERLKGSGTEVVVVSASPENWILPWTQANGYSLIATRLKTENGRLSGKIDGNNCHGDEKVCRIRDQYDLAAYDIVAAYGDTSGDRPMMKLANTSYFKPFRT